jgi:carboxyl-terminal processing protease
LRLYRFDEQTVELLDAGIARLNAAGMRALILDLRGNPGGLFSSAIEIADRFVDRGVLVTTHGQIREYNRVIKARGNPNNATPLIVLIDGETASSAEVLAAALHDQHRGTLLGQRTFGKGTIQETVRFRGGVGVTVTVARFLGPRGQAVDSVGIDPDVSVADSPSAATLPVDAQLQSALDLARSISAMGP